MEGKKLAMKDMGYQVDEYQWLKSKIFTFLASSRPANHIGVDKKSTAKAKQYTAVFSTKLEVETDGKISK